MTTANENSSTDSSRSQSWWAGPGNGRVEHRQRHQRDQVGAGEEDPGLDAAALAAGHDQAQQEQDRQAAPTAMTGSDPWADHSVREMRRQATHRITARWAPAQSAGIDSASALVTFAGMPATTKIVGLDHISAPVRDLKAARKFYEAALGAVGMKINMDVGEAFGMGSGDQKIFWMARDKKAGGGGHYAFSVDHPEEVDAFYEAAIRRAARTTASRARAPTTDRTTTPPS